MMCDIFIEANLHYNFKKIIDDPDEYVYLTDYIVYEIERSEIPILEKAKDLIKRLKTRDIYKFVSEILLTDD